MKRNWVFVVSACLLLIVVLANTLLAEQENKGTPSKAEVVQKTQKLQMPFVANEGQLDERVAFYARTFGGAVFVTKDGDIVYSLPYVAHTSSLVHNEINKQDRIRQDYLDIGGKKGNVLFIVPCVPCIHIAPGNFPVYYSETNPLICHTKSNSPVCHSERSEESCLNNSQLILRLG